VEKQDKLAKFTWQRAVLTEFRTAKKYIKNPIYCFNLRLLSSGWSAYYKTIATGTVCQRERERERERDLQDAAKSIAIRVLAVFLAIAWNFKGKN